jgi:hypothetical protein
MGMGRKEEQFWWQKNLDLITAYRTEEREE